MKVLLRLWCCLACANIILYQTDVDGVAISSQKQNSITRVQSISSTPSSPSIIAVDVSLGTLGLTVAAGGRAANFGQQAGTRFSI